MGRYTGRDEDDVLYIDSMDLHFVLTEIFSECKSADEVDWLRDTLGDIIDSAVNSTAHKLI